MGLLNAPEGAPRRANCTSKSAFYRITGPSGTRNIPAAKVDTTVLEAVARDLLSPEFVTTAVKSTREKFAVTHLDEIAAARAQIATLEARASKFLDMAAGLENPSPAYRKVDELERERAALLRRIVEWEKDDETAQALVNVTESQVRAMLRNLADEMRRYDPAELKDFLTSILDRVELDPVESTVRLCYRIPVRSGNSVASPRGFAAIPTIVACSWATVA